MIYSSVYCLRFILGPPWARIIGKSHLQHGSDYGGTVTVAVRRLGRSLCWIGANRPELW
jgi:hypothetical protein